MSEPYTRARRALCGKWLPFALLTAFMFTAIAATADDGIVSVGDSDRGEGLYENHCADCHDVNVHRRADRQVDSRDALYGWVAAWSVHAGLEWTADEIESVTSYLSRRLYGFTR